MLKLAIFMKNLCSILLLCSLSACDFFTSKPPTYNYDGSWHKKPEQSKEPDRSWHRKPNQPKEPELTPYAITRAIVLRQEAELIILLNRGAKVTPQQYVDAYEKQMYTATEKMIEHHSVDVNEVFGWDKQTLLYYFVTKKDLGKVKELLAAGADITINHVTALGMTALDLAFEQKLQDIISILCAHSAVADKYANLDLCPRPTKELSAVLEQCVADWKSRGLQVDINNCKSMRKAYRSLMKVNHPDVGGSKEAADWLNECHGYILKKCQGSE